MQYKLKIHEWSEFYVTSENVLDLLENLNIYMHTVLV